MSGTATRHESDHATIAATPSEIVISIRDTLEPRAYQFRTFIVVFVLLCIAGFGNLRVSHVDSASATWLVLIGAAVVASLVMHFTRRPPRTIFRLTDGTLTGGWPDRANATTLVAGVQQIDIRSDLTTLRLAAMQGLYSRNDRRWIIAFSDDERRREIPTYLTLDECLFVLGAIDRLSGQRYKNLRQSARAAGPDAVERHALPFCEHCGYDMTGLPTDRCPECGQVKSRKVTDAEAANELTDPI